MAKIHLFIDWDDEQETAQWADALHMPLEHFQDDDEYADFVSAYITRGLAYLTEEVELIGQRYAEKRKREREELCE